MTATVQPTATFVAKLRLRRALVDRIAEALWDANEQHVYGATPAYSMESWEKANEQQREYWIRQARVVVGQLSDAAVVAAEASQ